MKYNAISQCEIGNIVLRGALKLHSLVPTRCVGMQRDKMCYIGCAEV